MSPHRSVGVIACVRLVHDSSTLVIARRPHQSEDGGVSVLGCVMTVSLHAPFLCALFVLCLRAPRSRCGNLDVHAHTPTTHPQIHTSPREKGLRCFKYRRGRCPPTTKTHKHTAHTRNTQHTHATHTHCLCVCVCVLCVVTHCLCVCVCVLCVCATTCVCCVCVLCVCASSPVEKDHDEDHDVVVHDDMCSGRDTLQHAASN